MILRIGYTLPQKWRSWAMSALCGGRLKLSKAGWQGVAARILRFWVAMPQKKFPIIFLKKKRRLTDEGEINLEGP